MHPLGGPGTIESCDGSRLRAEVLGSSRSPALVLCHGWTMSRESWRAQRDLAGELRVVLFDQRGHGESDRRPPYTVEALAHDLRAVLDHALAPGERAVVAGHSMGSVSILAFAHCFPEQVADRLAGVAFVDTSGGAFRLPGLPRRGAGGARGIAGAAASIAFRGLARTAHAARRHRIALRPAARLVALSRDAAPDDVAFTLKLFLETDPRVMAGFARSLAAVDPSRYAPALDVPALVLVGRRDSFSSPDSARALARALPDAQLAEIPGSGHMSLLERPDRVNRLLRDFVVAC